MPTKRGTQFGPAPRLLLSALHVMRKEEVTINGLHVTALGCSDPNALFLHGGPGVFGYIENLCETVSSFCRPFFYNQRGSRQTGSEIGIYDHISDLKKIIDRLFPDSRPTLIGHSWGAMLAVLFASEYPNHVHKVIVVGIGPLNSQTGKEFMREILSRFGDQRGYFDELWENIENEDDEILQQAHANKYINEVVPFYQNGTESVSKLGPLYWDFKASFKTMTESDAYVETGKYENALSKMQCPIVVIHGSNDLLSPKFLFPIFTKYHPAVKLYEIEGAGHYPWIGNTEGEFIKILTQEIIEAES